MFWDGDLQWFTPTEVGKTKYVQFSSRTITQKGYKASSAKMLPAGAVLLTTRATIGDASIALRDCCTNQGFQSLIAKNDNDNEFLYYLIQTKRKELKIKANGSTFIEISNQEVKNVNVMVPDSKTQTKIAGFLSLIDKRIETQNKIIDNLKSQIKSVSSRVYKLFSKTSKLSELISFEKKTNHKSEEGLKEGLYPFYTNEENQNKFFNSYDFDGQFILSNTGGRANFKIVNGKFAVMSDTLVIKFKNPFLARTYINFLQNNTEKISHNIFAGSGLKHLDKNAFLNINVPLIDNDLSIINKLFETLDNKLINEKKYLSLLIIQKQYLLNNLFI